MNTVKSLQRVSKDKELDWKIAITEIKNTLEEINSRLDHTKEWISELEHRVVEIIKVEQKKKKKVFKLRIVQETSGATSNILAFTL